MLIGCVRQSNPILAVFVSITIALAIISTVPSPQTIPALATTASTTGVIVPLYTYPTSSTWDAMISAKTAHPSVPIVAIINPSSGPGTSMDSKYSDGIKKLQAAGITVLGYVYTSYTSRSTNVVKADIDSYKSWYPSLSGIFFDEMANWAGGESYYKTLNDYAKSKGFTFTVGNPGADTISSYVGTVDNIIIYESAGAPTLSSIGGWHTNYDKANFSIIPYAISSLDDAYVDSSSDYVGYMYITNDDLPNPWDSLPPYFADLVSAVNSANGSPSSPPTTFYSVTVRSADLNGNLFNGMWTTVSKDGVVLKTGYTPLSFSAESGVNYQVTVSNYQNYVFDHWENGSTNSARTISVTSDTTLTAYYSTGAKQVKLTVKSADTNGRAITGVSTTISKGDGTVVRTGYTPLSTSVLSGTTYYATVSDYKNYKFDHWEDGSKSKTRTITPSSDMTLIAYFSKAVSSKTR
jgi:hypothetical protein